MLVFRIYLIGLAQVAALAITLWLAREATHPHTPPHGAQNELLIAALLRDPASLPLRLRELKERANLEVSIRDAHGAVIAQNADVHEGPGVHTVALTEGRVAYLHEARPPHGADQGWFAIAATLVLVGISALATAAWIGRPLGKLAETARALGAGNLSARAGFTRKDELGEVAAAFDEMAGRIEELVRGQRELLANVSHELRTPLARIRIALDLAAEGSVHELNGIAGDLGELERLTNDILASARLELSSGAPPLRTEPLLARQLVEDVAARFRTSHPARALRLEDASGEARLFADRMLLRRVLDNLLDNAVRHSEGEVQLAARSEAGALFVEVRDQGQGIAREDLPRLFTPFFRADRSRDRKSGGLGLGLVLARRIAEAHGGTVEIESESGKGTTARLRVPLAS